ncbi:MAG: 30S ribosomal protein S20 [Patescibacteria group bacterium]
MPITSSAKKALRASLRKRVFNLRRKDQVSHTVKSLKKFIVLGKKKEAQVEMHLVQQALDKAVKGHTLDKNTASRKKSRLSKLIKKL